MKKIRQLYSGINIFVKYIYNNNDKHFYCMLDGTTKVSCKLKLSWALATSLWAISVSDSEPSSISTWTPSYSLTSGTSSIRGGMCVGMEVCVSTYPVEPWELVRIGVAYA